MINSIALILHIVFGYTALLSGGIVLATKKGNSRHKLLGRLFFYSMLLVSVSAVFLSIVKDSRFLLHIGIFVLYQTYGGFRSARGKSIKPNGLEILILCLSIVNTIAMLQTVSLLMVFGIISGQLILQDLYFYFRLWKRLEIKPKQWLIRHIGMMMGAYIGTLTAFLVVNVQSFNPPWLGWILPTLVLVPLMQYWTWKFTRSKKPTTKKALMVLLLLSSIPFSSSAQPYITGGNTRHRFAQLTLGMDTRTHLSYGTKTMVFDVNHQLGSKPLSSTSQARINIGGLHFWGHADFFIAIPVYTSGRSSFGGDVETGGRYYPWKIKSSSIRPFIGLSWLPTRYKQGEGSRVVRNNFPASVGLTYNHKHHLIEVVGGYTANNPLTYYATTSQTVEVQRPKYHFGIGYKFMIETTVSAEKDWKSGRTAFLTDTLSKLNRLNGFTLAIGPSSAIFLSPSSYNTEKHPYLDHHKFADIFPEFGIGYYRHKPDLQINLAFRNIRSRLHAFGRNQKLRRKALSLEVYKFIGDYHGFVPFIGPALSREWLEVNESNNSNTSSNTHQGLHPGLTFGWDIRPNRLQAWYLRTNLRWFPRLNLDMPQQTKLSFHQLEFNFIQLVVFPGRLLG